MEILEAHDLTGSFRDAAELAGCSHHTVAAHVAARDAGRALGASAPRPQLIDAYLAKVEEWVEQSSGKIRADKAHDKLLALGYTGSERTTRRSVAIVKKDYRAGRRRVHRPWVTEPGMWLQYDFGDGPVIDGVKTTLFCAWLAGVVAVPRGPRDPGQDDAKCLRRPRRDAAASGWCTDLRADRQREDRHCRARRGDRGPQPPDGRLRPALRRHHPHLRARRPGHQGRQRVHGETREGGPGAKDTNLLTAYASFAELEAACEVFCEEVNTRVHRVTRRAPAQMLAEEQARLHPVPAHPHTVAFGLTRTVPATMPMVAFEAGQYSVPHTLLGETVWVRVHGRGNEEQVVIVHIGPTGPLEVARHRRATPGSPKITEEHFPPAPAGALERRPRPKSAADAEFLALGEGAHMWLTEAAAAGSTKMRVKMAQALGLAKLFDPAEVDWALGHAAVHGRFAEADLASILDHHAGTRARGPGQQHRAGEDHSLTQGTSAWARLGEPIGEDSHVEDGVDDGVVA